MGIEFNAKKYIYNLCNFTVYDTYLCFYCVQKSLVGFTRISLIVYEKLISNRTLNKKIHINYHKTI